MSWDKGTVHEKDALWSDFQSCVAAMTDVLTRYDPKAGTAALGYMIACLQISMPKKDFDEVVAFYVGKIKVDILDKLKGADKELIDKIKTELKQKHGWKDR